MIDEFLKSTDHVPVNASGGALGLSVLGLRAHADATPGLQRGAHGGFDSLARHQVETVALQDDSQRGLYLHRGEMAAHARARTGCEGDVSVRRDGIALLKIEPLRAEDLRLRELVGHAVA